MSKWCALVYVMSGIPSGTTRSQPGETRSEAAVAASPSAEGVGAPPAAARRRGLSPARWREAPSALLAFQGCAKGASGGQEAQSGAKVAHRPAAAAVSGSCAADARVRRGCVRRGVQASAQAAQRKPSNTHRAAHSVCGFVCCGRRAGAQRAAACGVAGVFAARERAAGGGAQGERERRLRLGAARAPRRERGQHRQRGARAAGLPAPCHGEGGRRSVHMVTWQQQTEPADAKPPCDDGRSAARFALEDVRGAALSVQVSIKKYRKGSQPPQCASVWKQSV